MRSPSPMLKTSGSISSIPPPVRCATVTCSSQIRESQAKNRSGTVSAVAEGYQGSGKLPSMESSTVPQSHVDENPGNGERHVGKKTTATHDSSRLRPCSACCLQSRAGGSAAGVLCRRQHPYGFELKNNPTWEELRTITEGSIADTWNPSDVGHKDAGVASQSVNRALFARLGGQPAFGEQWSLIKTLARS